MLDFLDDYSIRRDQRLLRETSSTDIVRPCAPQCRSICAPGRSICEAMLHVVHHPGYAVETERTGTFPHDKYALVMRLLGESGQCWASRMRKDTNRTWGGKIAA